MNKILNIFLISVILAALVSVVVYQQNQIDDVTSLKNYYSTLNVFNCQKEDCFSVENKNIKDKQVIITKKLHFEFNRIYVSLRDNRSYYDSYYDFNEKKLYFESTIDNCKFTGNYKLKKDQFNIVNESPNTTNPEILNDYKTLEQEIRKKTLDVMEIIQKDLRESIK